MRSANNCLRDFGTLLTKPKKKKKKTQLSSEHHEVTKKRATYGKAPNPRLRMQYLMVQKIYQQKFHWTTIYIHLPSRKLRAHQKMNGLEDDPFLFWQVWTVSFRYGKSKDRADHRGEVTNASSPQNNWMSSSQPPSEVTMDSLASQGGFFSCSKSPHSRRCFFGYHGPHEQRHESGCPLSTSTWRKVWGRFLLGNSWNHVRYIKILF